MSLSSKEQNKGFTLTEIIVVVIIVGVLATLVIPRFTGVVERVRAAEGVRMLIALLGAQKAYELENGAYATDPDDLDIEITRASYFVVPPTVLNTGAPLAPIARIRRTGNYWLEINEEGTISCVDAGAPFTCTQAGH